ncbi:Neurexophilin [Mactra antiquata]
MSLPECRVDEEIDPRETTFYNIISEDEALSHLPCIDERTAASPAKSKIQPQGDRTTYNLGEVIRITITVYNDYGLRKSTGGDQLRATLHNLKFSAHAPGIVTDNNDGTYTAELKAFWTGPSVVNVSISYTRELITALYRVRNQLLATRNIVGQFTSRTYTETRMCHPSHKRMVEVFNRSEICNMTYINSGMPFYCLKPTNQHLLCQDWTHVKTNQPYPELPYSDCEEKLLKRAPDYLHQTLIVQVVDRPDLPPCTITPIVRCSRYNRKRLWTTRQPTGYFAEGKWNSALCRGKDMYQLLSCMKDRRLYLIGDSTLRHWYRYILLAMKCTPTTELWTTEKWHKEAECEIKDINFRAGWYPHSQPFFVGIEFDDVKYTLYSVSRRLDDIPSDEDAVVIVQLYMHTLSFHHSVFEERMKRIRRSIEKFLDRNRKSIVMIKGPHTFTSTPASNRLNDYFGFLYNKLLYEIFEGLHDRVVYLNNMDATIALQISFNHPPSFITAAMVKQALSFACS